MSEGYARNVLKVAMAQICQNLGWHAVQTTPMDILVDILEKYLSTLAKVTHQYAEHYNRTEPSLDDLALGFNDLGVSLSELEDYVNNVEPVPFIQSVPKFPVSHSNQFNFPKENSREVDLRPEWIHPHLPCIYPEDEESVLSPADGSGSKETPDTPFLTSDIPSPSGSPKPGSRRPLELSQDNNFTPAKRPRLLSDEEGRSVREVLSVSMTPAGLISPYREGRLPDTCTPLKGFEDSRPSSPVISEEAEESPPPSVAVVEPPPILPPVIPPEVVKVKKSKIKDGSKHKIKKDNKENKKKDLKDSKSKKKEALKAQLKVKDKLTKLAKQKKLKNYKITKLPKPPKTSLESLKHKKLGRPKKMKSDLAPTTTSETVHQSAPPPVKAQNLKVIKRKVIKSPKIPKVKKSLKTEKAIAGGQLASLLAKASSSTKLDKFNPEYSKPSEHDSYPRDSNIWSNGVNVPQVGLHDQRSNETFPPVVHPRELSDYDQHANNSNSSSNLRSDSEEIPSFRSKIKLEPKDVYDFTDDEDNRQVEPPEEPREKRLDPVIPVRTVESVISPTPPLPDLMGSSLTSPDVAPKKKRGRPPKYPKKETSVSVVSTPRPWTPDPMERSPVMGQQQQRSSFSNVPNFGMSPINSNMSFFPLANIPPALLPFPMTSFPPSTNPPPMNMGGPAASSSGGMTPYPKLVDLADVAISKAQHDGDFDVGRSKDKDKVKRKRDRKDKEKQKIKKKKDKSRDKSSEKSSSGKSEKNREKVKAKKLKLGDSSKSKEKKDKGEKSKDKKKEKSKDKEKRLEKKKEKTPKLDKEDFKEEKKVERSPPHVTEAAIPRLTFKLGSGTESESPKIVIKGLSNTDSPSSSPLPYASDRSPPGSPLLLPPPPPMPRPMPGVATSVPGSTHSKPHMKATAKVAAPPPSAPTRTVITETVGTIIDASGNKIWICPACTHPDDGSPMIGCDDCDEWYHWICVGIVVPPNEDENWFCSRCIAKQQSLLKKRRYRKDN